MLTAGWVTIPIFVAFLAVVPHLRQRNYDAAKEAIKNPKQVGTREALELLTEGCWVEYKWKQMLGNFLTTALFGKCHDLNRANLSNANLSGANLNRANLINTDLINVDLSRANLSGANLSSIKSGIDTFFGFNLFGNNIGNFKKANFKNAIYDQATKFSDKFDPTKEQMLFVAPESNLSNADLSNFYFELADFQGINLTNANLKASDLRYVQNLTPEQVKAAKNWEKAKYSDEFRKKLGLK